MLPSYINSYIKYVPAANLHPLTTQTVLFKCNTHPPLTDILKITKHCLQE